MDTGIIRDIKHIVIRALVSDDEIMEAIALKGGSAIEEFYNPDNKARASIDIDFSLSEEFFNFPEVNTKVESLLETEFVKSNYRMLDFNFYPNPKIMKDKIRSGYKIEFKVVSKELFESMLDDLKKLRDFSYFIDKGKSFKIEISSYEYIDGSEYKKFDNYDVKVYTPVMIVCEKLRAICQQTKEYKAIIQSNRPSSARARDFYDIHYLVTKYKLDLTSTENRDLLVAVFSQKKVPVPFLKLIKDSYSQHVLDEDNLNKTVPKADYKGFKFYFDYVVDIVSHLDFKI